MRAGSLRHQITIQSKTETQSATGEMVETWDTFAFVWGAVEPLSVREFIAAQGVQSEITARILIRYLSGVTPSMRVVHQGKIYNIHGVQPDKKSGREYLTLAVSEGVNDG